MDPETSPPPPVELIWRRRFLYRSYARFHRFSDWRRRKFTPTGYLVLWGTLITACFGIDTIRSTVYQVFIFLACLLMVSLVLSLKRIPRVDTGRILPDYATAGMPFAYTLWVSNQSEKTVSRLELQELFNDPRPGIDTFFSAREPFEHARNAWDRRLKVQRWSWLIRQAKNAQEQTVPVPTLAPGETVEIPATLTPLHRGTIHLQGVLCLRPEPLGIARSWSRLENSGRILVLPKRYSLPAMAIPGSRKHHNGGLSLTSRVGDSEEFISLRDYRPGDTMRKIHWKSWAKTDRLIIRENQEEHFTRHALILDTATRHPACLDFEVAVSLAASFVTAINTGESLLDLMFARNRVYRISSGRQVNSSGKLLEVLAMIQPGARDFFEDLSRSVLSHLKQLSGMILILTALDSQRHDLVRQLQRSGVTTTVFLVCESEDDAAGTDIHPVLIQDVQASLNRFRGRL